MVGSRFTTALQVSPRLEKAARHLLVGASTFPYLLRPLSAYIVLGLCIAFGGGVSFAVPASSLALASPDSGVSPCSDGAPGRPPVPTERPSQPPSTGSADDLVTPPTITTSTPATLPETGDDSAQVTMKAGKVTVSATESDVARLLRQVGRVTSKNVVIIGSVTGTVTLSLSDVTVERAVSLIAQAAGLTYRQDDDAFLIGTAASDANGAAGLASSTGAYSVYRCKHIQSQALATTLNATFDPQRFKAVVGPIYNSPSLESGNSSDDDSHTRTFQPLVAQTGDEQLRTLDVILSGDPTLVSSALRLCEQLDRHRKQVRLRVNISDVSVDAARDLGLQYAFGRLGFTERSIGSSSDGGTEGGSSPSNSPLRFARIQRTPFQFSAALSALESRGQAKILAQPTLSVLDGERTFILIGQRLTYPYLVTQSAIAGPTFDTKEIEVGIYIQVVARIGEDNDVTLAIYPQVSSISGYLDVNGTRYPQISTREQQTTVRARNGETFALGGLINETEVRNIERVPILSNIPILGELFKFRGRTKSRTELVLAITPEVLTDDGP